MAKCADKKFAIPGDQIVDLIGKIGACMASDKITVDGLHVGWMYREEPIDKVDNGWRFFSGTEDQEYVDDPEHLCFFDTNTIANYDRGIIPYLGLSVGVELVRGKDGRFELVQ
jgi:hypothetical protein